MITPDRRPMSAMRRLLLVQLLATFAFAASVVLLIYFATTRLIEAETRKVVETELLSLIDDYENLGPDWLSAAIGRRTDAPDEASAIYMFASPEGVPITGNIRRWPDIEANGSWHVLSRFRTDIAKQVMVGGRADTLSDGRLVFVGRDMQAQRAFNRILLAALGSFLLVFALLETLGGFAISSTVLKRMQEIEDATDEIAAGDISKRAPVRGTGDEFDRMASSLNRALDRNETLVGELRTVTDGLAHDLRTPLARLRGRLESVVDQTEMQPALANEIGGAIEQLNYVEGVFRAMLDIVRAESGIAREQFETVDLGHALESVTDLYQPLAEDKQVTIIVTTETDLNIFGHAQFLSSAIANLLDNAVKYAPNGSTIEARAGTLEGCPYIEVSDEGPGIEKDMFQQALRRFSRLEKDRGQTGAGLGLSLVATVVRMHGASLERMQKDKGLCVRIRFQGGSNCII